MIRKALNVFGRLIMFAFAVLTTPLLLVGAGVKYIIIGIVSLWARFLFMCLRYEEDDYMENIRYFSWWERLLEILMDFD